jgi:hypothetical protein
MGRYSTRFCDANSLIIFIVASADSSNALREGSRIILAHLLLEALLKLRLVWCRVDMVYLHKIPSQNQEEP